MKEKDFKNLVEKSKLQTSDRFVDDLMLRIHEKEVAENLSVWSPRFIIPAVSFALLSLSFFLFKLFGKSLSFPGIDFSISKTAFFVPAFFLFLLLINYLVKVTENLHKTTGIS